MSCNIVFCDLVSRQEVPGLGEASARRSAEAEPRGADEGDQQRQSQARLQAG